MQVQITSSHFNDNKLLKEYPILKKFSPRLVFRKKKMTCFINVGTLKELRQIVTEIENTSYLFDDNYGGMRVGDDYVKDEDSCIDCMEVFVNLDMSKIGDGIILMDIHDSLY